MPNKTRKAHSLIEDYDRPNLSNNQALPNLISLRHSRSIARVVDRDASKGPAAVANFHKKKSLGVQALLESIKQGYKKLEEQFSKEWDSLEASENRLRLKFNASSKFIEFNAGKRERGLAKIKHYKSTRDQITKDIVDMKKTLIYYAKVKCSISEDLEKFEIYVQFLDRFKKLTYPMYPTLMDILTRYEYLNETKDALGKRLLRDTERIRKYRADTQKLLEKYYHICIGMETTVSGLWTRKTVVAIKMRDMENLLMSILYNCIQRLSEMQTVKNTCWELYSHMCDRLNLIRHIQPNDTINQLLYIKDGLNKIIKVVKKCHRVQSYQSFNSPTI